MPTPPRYVMVIDLRHCFGCKTCVAACSQANHTPEGLWRKVADLGVFPQSDCIRLTVPVGCMHCDRPACMDVCPTGATQQRDGIVYVDPQRCIGCGYCILACPYDARAIYRRRMDFDDDGRTTAKTDSQNRIGTCTKCDFCRDRLQQGLAKGLTPGEDPGATPACVLNCSAQALAFGDLNDPASNVARLVRAHTTIRLGVEKGTEPQVYYIVDAPAEAAGDGKQPSCPDPNTKS